MAVTVLTEKPARQPMPTTGAGPVRYRAWDIYAESEQDAVNELYSREGVKRGTIYRDHQGTLWDYRLICQDIVVRARVPAPVDGYGLYEVTARYAYSTEPQLERAEPPSLVNPNPVRWWTERALVSQPVDHDINGNPIVNPSMEPIDPPLTALMPRIVRCAEWIREARHQHVLEAQMEPYVGKVNSTTWHHTQAPMGCLLCLEITVSRTDLPVAHWPYYRMVGRWEYRPQKTIYGQTYPGWQDTVLNRGRREPAGTNPAGVMEYCAITDINAIPQADPVLLDQQGMRLAAGQQPLVLAWWNYASINFQGIGIG